MQALEHSLRRGVADLGLTLTDGQIAGLLAYLALMEKWTRVYNLTAVRDPAEMLTHHLLDSLAVIEPLRRQLLNRQPTPLSRLLDVGSGAGLPGVVIAICCPDIAVHCVDTVAKKVAFIQQVGVALKLHNLRSIHGRIENITDKYDVISARAFASLADLTSWSAQALAEHGIWMAMKGKVPVDELAALPQVAQVFHVEPLKVPGLDAQRCLVWMRALI